MAGVELCLAHLPAGQEIPPASLEFRSQSSHEDAAPPASESRRTPE